MKTLFSLLILVCSITASALAQNAPAAVPANLQARFLAGLPVRGTVLEERSRDPVYAEHAAFLDKAWNRKEQTSLNPLRAWARSSGGEFYGKRATVYYFFSGPDFLYANTFFPNASTYILCGTEPIGAVDLTRIPPQNLNASLANLRKSMSTMLNFHYFITKEMRSDLQGEQLGGTLPILYVFIARLGGTLEQVSSINSPAPGVRIAFRGAGGQSQTLYYFKVDLSNGSSGAFLRWCGNQGPGMSLLKAASYLLHNGSFSQTRQFLLDHSQVIVQDDSGIPLRDFDQRWAMRYFGNYDAPIALFAKNSQPELAATYQRSNPAPLRFAFGYHWQVDKSLLMVGTRK